MFVLFIKVIYNKNKEGRFMIKVIAFDLVGVLVKEKDIELSSDESKLERMFGPNINDTDYLSKASNMIEENLDIMTTTKNIIQKLYEVKNKEIMKKIKVAEENIKIVIATNHLSYIRSFIEKNFDKVYLDDIVISAEINKIKPNTDFYEHILHKFNVNPNELLFLDDNIENINGADKLGINTIKVEKNMDLLNEILNFLK